MRLAPLALLAALGLARPASADEDPGRPAPSARLVYTRLPGAERCPAQQAIEDAVATRLGYTPFREDAPIVVTAVIERRASSIRRHPEHGHARRSRALPMPDEIA